MKTFSWTNCCLIQHLLLLPLLLSPALPVGEALSANPDALQDAVAPQLVQNEGGVDLAGLHNGERVNFMCCAVANYRLINSYKWHNLISTKCSKEVSVQFPLYLLLVVGNDTADKVGVCIPEGDHQLGQLFLGAKK